MRRGCEGTLRQRQRQRHMTAPSAADAHQAGGGSAELGAQLELIARMIQDFASSLDIDATLRRALARISEHIGAEGGAIFLLDDTQRELVCHACYGPAKLTGLRLDRGEGVVGRSVRRNTCELVRDALTDRSFAPRVDRATGFTTRSILCAPLSVQERRLGAIELVNKRGGDGRFDTPDAHLLQALASAAALALLNARLAADLVKQERDRRELALAAEIQRSLLPDPRGPCHLSGLSRPARLVSGDFYDFLPLDDGRVGFAIGDVSGKGMQAALLMAKTASLYHCLAKSEASPGRLLAVIDREICETSTRGMFVTMVAGVYEPCAGRVRLANAGHEPPLLERRDGSFAEFPALAPPVGVGVPAPSGEPFPEHDIDLDGGTLYLFTDGLTEAATAGRRGPDSTPVQRLIADTRRQPLPARLEAIAARVSTEPLRDDLTILAVDGAADVHAEAAAGDSAARLLNLRFLAQPDRLKDVRAAVRAAMCRTGCSEACTQDVVLAVDEACQNIIRHGYRDNPAGEIVLEVDRADDRVVLWLRDFAPKVDERTIKPRDLDQVRPGGLGVHFIREAMDEARFVPCASGNVLRMVKRLG